jgi:hypothetical protein
MRLFWHDQFTQLVGNAGFSVYGMLAAAAIVLVWKVRAEMTANRLGRALAKALGEPIVPEEPPYPMRQPVLQRSRERRLRRSGSTRS